MHTQCREIAARYCVWKEVGYNSLEILISTGASVASAARVLAGFLTQFFAPQTATNTIQLILLSAARAHSLSLRQGICFYFPTELNSISPHSWSWRESGGWGFANVSNKAGVSGAIACVFLKRRTCFGNNVQRHIRRDRGGWRGKKKPVLKG